MRLDLNRFRSEARKVIDTLNLEQKASLCSGKDFWHTKSIPLSGINSLMLTDGPHGLRKQEFEITDGELKFGQSVEATCFPTASALACSWDRQLLEEIGGALGKTCLSEKVAILLGPGINIKRNPLCGRNFEYISEDPLVSGELAASLIAGLQDKGIGASLKHFAANNQETFRTTTNAIVDQRSLHELYLKGFEIAVRKSQPATVMCAYNRLNGEYCAENYELLAVNLRQSWGFKGFLVSDWGAVNDRIQAIKAGLDLEMPASAGVNDQQLVNAVRSGALDEKVLDNSLVRLVSFAIHASELFSTAHPPVDEDSHHRLAQKAAIESAVLLKNNDRVLPLTVGKSVAIIGEFAKNPRYQGAGSSQVNPTRLDTAYDAIKSLYVGNGNAAQVQYAPGYFCEDSTTEKQTKPLTLEEESLIDEAASLALKSDVAIIFAGLPPAYESEGYDRESLRLPINHNELISAVSRVNTNTIVVLQNGGCVEMPWVNSVPAILECYLNGQAGGSAVAELLFGLANPSGKLAESFPLTLESCPSTQWYPPVDDCIRRTEYREGMNVGYRYFDTVDAEVLFPFGHGLSYSEFHYKNPRLSSEYVSASQIVDLSVEVSNHSEYAGAEIVQIYAESHQGLIENASGYLETERPIHELKAFRKIFLNPQETQTVSFELRAQDFSYFSTKWRTWMIEDAVFNLQIASSSRDIRLTIPIRIQGEDSAGGERDIVDGSPAPYPIPRKENEQWILNDDQFCKMLGHAIPPIETVRPFHLNSTLSDLSTSVVGSFFSKKIIGEIRKMVERSGAESDELERLVESALPGMPLRSLLLMSDGKITPGIIATLIDIMNHRYLSAVRRVIAPSSRNELE